MTKFCALEHLVHRRRLVHPAGDRLEVGDVEHVRVEAAVPADDVERVLRDDVHRAGQPARPVAAVLDVDLDVGALGQQRLGRPAQVALAVRRVLEELAVPRQVALRRGDVAVRLDRVGAQRLVPGRHPAVGGGPREDHVVALRRPPARRTPSRRVRRAALDVDALVADGVAVERRRSATRPRRRSGRRRCRAPAAGRSPRRRPCAPRRGTGRAASGAAASAGRSASVVWSGSSHGRASTIADGMPRW